MKRIGILCLLSVAVLLAACDGSSPSLTGVMWTVTSMPGVGIVPTTTTTATFGADGKVTGSGGCNNYGAAYTVSGSSLTVSSPTSSMMSCNEGVDQDESQYFYLLENTSAYEIKGNTLTLKDSSGQKLIEFTSGS